MPTPLRRRLRLARRSLWYGLAVGLVCMAVVLGIASQVLPLAERHPDRIAAWLSERAGRPVAFDQVDTQWTRRGPLLRLDGLRLGEGADAVRIGEAEVLVSMYAGLLPGRSFTELRLRGLSLTLQRDERGAWSVLGLPGQRQGGDPLEHLEGLGELQVIDASLAVRAPSLGWDQQLPHIDLRLRVDENRVRAGTRVWANKQGAPIQVAFDFERDSGDGRAYLDARKIRLSDWSSLLQFAGIQAQSGNGRIQAWAELRQHQVTQLTAQTGLEQVHLRGAPLAQGRVPQVELGEVEARMRWRLLADGWRLDAPHLRVGAADASQDLDGLVIAGGKRYALLADQVDAAALLAVAGLSNRLEPGLRQWLNQAKPGARLSKVEVAGTRGGPMRAEGRLEGFKFAAVGDSPGVAGLSGGFVGDAEGFVFELTPRTPLRFDWPSGFGVAHDVTLEGAVAGWREGQGWRIGTPGLRVRGKDFGAHARGGLWFQGDGTRPWIDIAAEIDEAPVTAAKGFWIHHKMPAAAVHWLDNALVGGKVSEGRALISGDLDDWPFVHNNGRFEALAKVKDGVFRFQPNWPAMDHVAADLAFVGNGFSIQGTGALAGVPVAGFTAGIPDFSKAELSVEAQGAADASKLLALLRLSPLQKQYGDTLTNLSASGATNATYSLLLPMHDGLAAKRRMKGTVALREAKLADKRWNLAFDRVSGKADFNADGFTAEKLTVNHQGRPGQLSLRAGGGVRDQTQAFEAELTGNLSARELLDRAPEMAWLKPYVDGRSQWTVGVALPKGGNPATPSLLTLRSDLVGTTLKLPAPLDKPAFLALPTRVQTAMPLGAGQIEVAFGKLLALRARNHGNQTGVRVVLGSDSVNEAPPQSGLVATGHTSTLDAVEWVSLAKRGGSTEGGLALRQIDVQAERLLLLGATFPDTRLQVTPAGAALAVTVEGPALAGSLKVPGEDRGLLAGQFSRLHWRAAAPGVASAKGGEPGDAFDPAAIPPLALDIADLRFGDARLGSAQLRTQPLPDGMHVQKLELRTPKQQIDISGHWIGQGVKAQTRMSTQVQSQDVGALLEGLGLKGRVRGGHGEMKFEASWPGSPGAFSLAAMEGELHVAVRDGQLLEVEPGAGRVLGLLSLTQLPRRMMLDFRDFFSKGFAFNRIDGKVQFGAGSARSEGVVIDGPAAEISIRGNTDLRAQQFDQTIDVMPKSGNLLAVVGAVAGGPLGAAVGAAANAVLKKPLGEIGAKTYRVTGPWKDPKVEVMTREQSRLRSPAASDAAGAP